MLTPPATVDSCSPTKNKGVSARVDSVARSFIDEPTEHTAKHLVQLIHLCQDEPFYLLSEVVETSKQHSLLELLLAVLSKWPDCEFNNHENLTFCISKFSSSINSYSATTKLKQFIDFAVSSELLDWHDLVGFSRACLDYCAEPGGGYKLKRDLMSFLLTIFEYKPDSRSQLVSLVLHYTSKPLEYERDQTVSKYSDKKVNFIAILLIEFVQIVGFVEFAQLDEAVAYSRRNEYQTKCLKAVRSAEELSTTLAKHFIDRAGNNPLIFDLVEDLLQALFAPELAGSEVIIRSICVLLMVNCRNYSRKLSYPPTYILELMGTIQRSLYHIFCAQESKGLGTVVDYLVSNRCQRAALFCTTSQCAVVPEDYRDFQLRFTNPQSRVASIVAKRWIQILKTQKIGKYYENTLEAMLALSESGLPAPTYITILKSLSAAIKEYPEFFHRLKGYLLRNLPIASPAVCDWTVNITANYFAATKLDIALLTRLMSRVHGPGNQAYKKRCINLLDQTSQLNDPLAQFTSWKFLLVLCNDSKPAINHSAVQKLVNFIETASHVTLYDILSKISKLGTKYTELLLHILSQPVDKKVVHNFVSFLLKSLDGEPDYEQIKVASLFIIANGLYLPPSKVPTLIHLSVQGGSSENRLVILNMLESALTTKPRIILSAKVVEQVYRKIVRLLPSYNEQELEKIGRIVWELANIGDSQGKQQRQLQLSKLYDLSLQSLPTAPAAVKPNLINLASMGARYWVHNSDCVNLLIGLAEEAKLRQQIIRAVCRICTQFPHLFLNGPCHDFFRANVFEPRSEEWNEFMGVFLDFLESRKTVKCNGIDKGVLHGTEASLVADSTLSGLFQTYFPALEQCALAQDHKSSITATRLLWKGITTSKFDSSACSSTVTILCCSGNTTISQIAQDCFECLVERNQLEGFVHGLKSTTHFSQSMFQRFFEMMQSMNVKAVLSELVAEFTSSRNFALLTFNGLCQLELPQGTLNELQKVLDNAIYTLCGESQYTVMLIALRALVQFRQNPDHQEYSGSLLQVLDGAQIAGLDCDTILRDLHDASDPESVFEILESALHEAGERSAKKQRLD